MLFALGTPTETFSIFITSPLKKKKAQQLVLGSTSLVYIWTKVNIHFITLSPQSPTLTENLWGNPAYSGQNPVSKLIKNSDYFSFLTIEFPQKWPQVPVWKARREIHSTNLLLQYSHYSRNCSFISVIIPSLISTTKSF